MIAALYPLGFLIAQLGFAIVCAAVLSPVLWPVHSVLGIVSWGIIWPILALFQKYDGKIFAHYLMQDYAHTAAMGVPMILNYLPVWTPLGTTSNRR